jgi:hypothetical protein
MPAKLADRVTDVENEVAALKEALRGTAAKVPAPESWRATVGAFKDDPV